MAQHQKCGNAVDTFTAGDGSLLTHQRYMYGVRRAYLRDLYETTVAKPMTGLATEAKVLSDCRRLEKRPKYSWFDAFEHLPNGEMRVVEVKHAWPGTWQGQPVLWFCMSQPQHTKMLKLFAKQAGKTLTKKVYPHVYIASYGPKQKGPRGRWPMQVYVLEDVTKIFERIK